MLSGQNVDVCRIRRPRPVNSNVKHQSLMSAISRANATLRVIGSDLNPEEISSLLGGLPTRANRKGDDLQKSPYAPVRPATAGLWAVEAQLATPSDVNLKIVDLLNGLTDDLLVWKRILLNKKKIKTLINIFLIQRFEIYI